MVIADLKNTENVETLLDFRDLVLRQLAQRPLTKWQFANDGTI